MGSFDEFVVAKLSLTINSTELYFTHEFSTKLVLKAASKSENQGGFRELKKPLHHCAPPSIHFSSIVPVF